MKSRSICILGMHRSGTSAMAGVLNALGGYSGKDEELLPRNRFNRKGYFERFDVIALNETILCENAINNIPFLSECDCFRVKMTLDGFGWIFGAWTIINSDLIASNQSIKQIKSIIARIHNTAQDRPWILKDPRLALTLPQWQHSLGKSAAIIMIRNPADITRSLFERENIIPSISYNLWLLYTYSAIVSSRNIPSIIIDYDQLIDSSKHTIETIVDFLNSLGWNPQKGSIDSALSFLTPELRHRTNNTFFIPPDRVMNLYHHILNNHADINDSILTKLLNEVPFDDWGKALYLPAISRHYYLQQIIDENNSQIIRLNNHPITGPLIKLLRWLKRDNTFGSCENKIDEEQAL
jgi:hypothetical protein